MKITDFNLKDRKVYTKELQKKIVDLAHRSNTVIQRTEDVDYFNPFIEIIKEFRNFTGVGLKEAKDAVEACSVAGIGEMSRKNWTSPEIEKFVENVSELFFVNSGPVKVGDDTILTGLKLSIEAWGELGYNSPIESVRAFVKRWESK
jgi:hypothetical protein